MPAVTGRSPAARTITCTTTSSSTALTAPAGTFDPAGDLGRRITGTGIPANATLAAIASATAATLSVAATASGTITAVLPDISWGANPYGFVGWSPKSSAQASIYSLGGGAGAADPEKITGPNTSELKRYTRA